MVAIGEGSVVLTVGTLVSFLTLIKNFTQPVSQISNQVNSVVASLAGAERVFNIMDQKSEDDGTATVHLVNVEENADGTLVETPQVTQLWAWKKPVDEGFELVKQQGEVDFSQVDFSYVPEKQVLFDIDLDTEAGQKVALVGGTGAGKTTITNLINRFYDIQDGTILYDNIPITSICKPDLRRSLGMVLQETHLFTGTVMDNIRYGRLDATDEECIAAAKLVHAHDFISRLAQGYNTMLNADGGNLSQGERQLIAIARAAVANPPALILDEATSNIDTRTEMHIQKVMAELMHGRTTFVIAHRLGTIRDADIIMVVEGGHIVERGTHDELIALDGAYKKLVTSE
jgi:ATP-binding cassette subfamily B protein